jgi:hypothetical protein
MLMLALVVASGPAVLLAAFPEGVQAWSRGAFARRAWLRAFTPACDFAALTDPRSAWLLRVYGFALVPVAALAARAVVAAIGAG